MPSAIARTLRAARERRGWTREALAYHSGVSWAAIAQIESGRRSDVRLSSLTALAGALGVTLDHLAGLAAGHAEPMLQHAALLHDSDEEFLADTVPFLAEGADRSEAPLAVTTRARVKLLRKALGGQAEHVELADSARWYSSPGDAMDRYRAYLDGRIADGALWVRIVGEPVWTGRSPAEIESWTRYESLINMTFAFSPVTLICPYDTRTTPPRAAAQAECTHPRLARDGGSVASAGYQDPQSFLIGHNPG